MTKELQEIEDSDSMTLNFVTYSDNELSVIDLDNAEIEDLTSINAQRKTERETVTQQFVLPQEVFFKNRTVSKENQEKLLHLLMTDSEFSKYPPQDKAMLISAFRIAGILRLTIYVAFSQSKLGNSKFAIHPATPINAEKTSGSK